MWWSGDLAGLMNGVPAVYSMRTITKAGGMLAGQEVKLGIRAQLMPA